ncbi:RDD family protein [Lysobacter solisilvae (ex Woo and Kim 2020)]|uniref:RDD family protein n=1 Tax=Agrilutibacter terrestris TaxID=2865112 RepID=A0A7H0FUC0_9GAMM|nr:RDD family protein [Lysobacter terrestris]QNP39636.1 RDD family protein [Lysobacter terrestris]
MSQWYYSDYQRNRLGPVAASDLADLHHAGQLQPDTLVWREGMPQWRAWREVMTQALNEAAGRTSPAADAVPLSAGVNPYAMAEPLPSAAPALAAAAAGPSLGTLSSTATLGAGANPYAVAEPSSPYAPPRAALHDGNAYVGGGEVVYAGFWKRFAAYFIDSVLVGIVTWIVQMIIMAGFGASTGLAARSDPGSMIASAGIVGFLFGMVIVPLAMQAVYFAWMHSSDRQATLGKMAVGIKVTDDDGQRISFARGIGRYFAAILSSLILCIGYLMAGFTERKRALHDMVASTLVVDQWAFTAHPERQRHELGTVTIVIAVIAGVLMVGYLLLIIGAVVALGMAAGAH